MIAHSSPVWRYLDDGDAERVGHLVHSDRDSVVMLDCATEELTRVSGRRCRTAVRLSALCEKAHGVQRS